MKSANIVKDNINRGRRNSGFTLVEMIIVLTIIAIMMSAAVWGVTGWIAHYEYISSEEKARTVYMAAQSALSAAESRGTLDDCIEDIRKEMKNNNTLFEGTDVTGLSKDTYGIPDVKDNEGNEHYYGYLSVSKGDYEALAEGAHNALFDLLETYVTDTEQLNGSIVIEFDLTAGKVYSAFYSGWASSISYDDSLASVERGNFYITKDHRTPEYREDYEVGYFGADQVNVVELDSSFELKVDECMLHNEETLYLTMNSTSLSADTDTVFNVELRDAPTEDNAGNKLCSFPVDWTMVQDVNPGEKKRVEIDVKDASDADMGKYAFILSYDVEVNAEGETKRTFNVTLDALNTSETMAGLNVIDENGRTDLRGYSITRLLGVIPKDIIARVSVEPADSAVIQYAAGSYLDSNPHNDLFKTKEDGGKYAADTSAFEIDKCRHLSNIRYVEEYEINGVSHTYALAGDIDWKDGKIYSLIPGEDEAIDKVADAPSGTGYSSEDEGYKSLDTTKIGFPMITKLNTGSVFDGEGYQISGLLLNNSSSVVYERNADGTLKNSVLVNSSKTLGLFGTNRGMIRRLIIRSAKETALSAEEFADKAGGERNSAVYSDTLEAAGIICGRSEGYMRELYFDKDCSVSANVYANLDDEEEARAKALSFDTDTTSYVKDVHENQIYGCGVGMVSGTVLLNDNVSFDRIRTSGKVTGRIASKDSSISLETPAVSDSEGRTKIYNEDDKAQGKYTNAQCYAYGIGGVFGYVYGGEFKEDSVKSGIGIGGNEVAANSTLPSDDASGAGYLPMYERVEISDTETDKDGNTVTVTKLVPSTDENDNLFRDWTSESIVNKADVEGEAFTGGIVGNICISGLSDNKSLETDGDGDITIPNKKKKAIAQIVNCYNYGDTKGLDFVGGIVGVNGEGGYIRECVSYGSPTADNGVSAGITSENFGYIADCRIDRAPADEDNDNKPYVPEISGNMLVAGAITSVNHTDCVVYNCKCAVTDVGGVDDKICITGDSMDTFGYIVGRNDGVVNGGISGQYLGYKSDKTKIIIGGAVGTNDHIVKNVTVTFDLVDRKQAETIGGIVGLNQGDIKSCIFGGNIVKTVHSAAGMTIGGIAAKNGNVNSSGAVEYTGNIVDCYLIGSVLDVKGTGNFVDTSTDAGKISGSSAVGGVCGINYEGSAIDNCHAASLRDAGGSIVKSNGLNVVNGMAGGICAVNFGMIRECGYSTKVFVNEQGAIEADSKSSGSDKDMDFAAKAFTKLEAISDKDLAATRAAVKALNEMFVDDSKGELTSKAKELLGDIPAPGFEEDDETYIYALPKGEYDVSSNDYIISMGNKEIGRTGGIGYIGGIVGYNCSSGSVKKCASGKWVVENYLPKVQYNATGGVIGWNAADSDNVGYNINFAYVRNELPKVPDSAINGSGQATDKNYNNNFYYVGGVIGTQANADSPKWTVEKCINVGTVLNYYGNNSGGVLCQVRGTGGTIQYCYNYGFIMAGYTKSYGSGYSGTGGGIVAHYTELMPDQTNNVLHCQNHGVITFPMQGLDYDTCIIHDKLGNMTANDTGGIVGEISAPQKSSLYVVRIEDCVNGASARVYANSKAAGILGTIGCFAKDGVEDTLTVNSITVVIDTCRNYSSQLWSSQGAAVNSAYKRNAGGILSGRRPYAAGEKPGYTSVQNCFSVRMYGFNSGGAVDTSNVGGRIGYYKSGSGNDAQNKEPYRYYGNNYYIDDYTFQYSSTRGRIQKSGFLFATSNIRSDINNNYDTSVNAFISESEPSDKVALATGSSVNSIDVISKHIISYRIYSVAYGEGYKNYAFIREPDNYNIASLNEKNAWIDGDYVCIYTKDEGVIKYPVLFKYTESGESAPYSVNLLSHPYFDRLQKGKLSDDDMKEYASKVGVSRLPYSDEYDMDYFDLDCDFVDYIDAYKKELLNNPDIIKNVNIAKHNDTGNYYISWDVEGQNGRSATATRFDVELRYYAIPDAEIQASGFDINKIDDDNDADEYRDKGYLVKTEYKSADSTTTTLVPPSDFDFDSGNRFYVVARVKDARAGDTGYSELEDKTVVDAESGEETTIQSYAELEPKLPAPKFEIVSYKGKWMLHLKNPERFTKYIGREGFEVGVYKLSGNNVKNNYIKLTADNIINTAGGNAEDQLLNNAIAVSSAYSNGNANQEFYCYATASGCLDSDNERYTVYIPKDSNPANIDYTLTAADGGDHLNDGDKKPAYSGVLSYNMYNKSGNTVIVPPIAQIFKVELYGVKKEIREDGNEVIWHETLASHEYSMSVEDTENVNIGYYDVPSSINLNDYDSFGVDYWYAATGQGEVYNYFETTKERADRSVRPSGFITDVSEAPSKPVYYFHSIKLKAPQVEIVCMERDPVKWYARLLNPEDYFGSGAKIYVNNNNSVYIDTSDTSLIGDVLPYAVNIGSGNSSRYFTAKSDGCYDSVQVYYGNINKTVYAQGNLQNYINVSYDLSCDTFADENGEVSEGSFTLDKDNNLSFRGTLQYNSHNNIGQYYRIELYARDKDEQEVTLYLSDDTPMEMGSVNNSFKTSVPIAIDIKGDDEKVDVSKYHDFHVAVWYSNADLNSSDKAEKDHGFAQYFKIPEKTAKLSASYDEDKNLFFDARAHGILIDISEGEDKPVYYYVAPLADTKYGDTVKYPKYVLYREASETVSMIRKDAEGNDIISNSGTKVLWEMYPNYYGGDIECDVNIKVYERANTLEAPTMAELMESTPFYEVTKTGKSPYFVKEEEDKEFDWSGNNYYALVRVKDSGVAGDEAYSDYTMVTMVKGLAKPKITVLALGGNQMFVHLDNYKDYEGYDNVTVYVELEGRNGNSTKPYEISLDSESWPAVNGIPIEYSVKRDSHNIKGGKTTSLVAYAKQKEPETGEVILESISDYKKTIYMPYWNEPVPNNMNIGIANPAFEVSADNTSVHYSADISFNCTNADYLPEVPQGFTVALVGTPNPSVDGYQRPTILTRTEDDYLIFEPNETKNVDITLSLDSSVKLNAYKDIYVYIWYSYDGISGCTKQEYEISQDVFDTYKKSKAGITVDYTNGTSGPRYFYERAFNDGSRGYGRTKIK